MLVETDALLGRRLGRTPAGSSLVDAVSFVVARRHRVDEAFAFDGHFEREGFAIVG